jgi:GNAT superfamily N-acetyltransferase
MNKENSNIAIRAYAPSDRQDIRRISVQTAFLEQPIELFLNDSEILADILTQYYTDHEPESCFVAIEQDRVIGYLTGAKNTVAAQKIFKSKILIPLIKKALKRNILASSATLRLFCHIVTSFLKGEFADPDFSKEYPATLHINIDKDYRGRHVGSQLIDHYLAFLSSHQINGVHFGSFSEQARNFFTQKGFALLHQGQRSYLRYRIGRTLNYYIFGKKITSAHALS